MDMQNKCIPGEVTGSFNHNRQNVAEKTITYIITYTLIAITFLSAY